MNLKNQTKNQHFISQTEQRLNASNPDAKMCNQQIYKFKILNREDHQIAEGTLAKIGNTLSLNDLFSFDVIGKKDRSNFEILFNKYETDLKEHTTNLLNKINASEADIKNEVVNLFVSKFLNFIRNPYTAKKVLNSFPNLTTYHPTDEKLLSAYKAIIEGRKPQIEYLCEQINLPKEDYINWLKTIFMLTAVVDSNGYNFLESLLAEIFNNPKTIIQVGIYQYDQEICLLSDRGFTNPLDQDGVMSFDFNLNKNSFIRFVFLDIQVVSPAWATEEIITKYCEQPKNIKVSFFKNDMELLDSYNKLVIYQSFEHVFAAKEMPFGVNINQAE